MYRNTDWDTYNIPYSYHLETSSFIQEYLQERKNQTGEKIGLDLDSLRRRISAISASLATKIHPLLHTTLIRRARELALSPNSTFLPDIASFLLWARRMQLLSSTHPGGTIETADWGHFRTATILCSEAPEILSFLRWSCGIESFGTQLFRDVSDSTDIAVKIYVGSNRNPLPYIKIYSLASSLPTMTRIYSKLGRIRMIGIRDDVITFSIGDTLGTCDLYPIEKVLF